jgi:hypothetical protein
VVLLGVKKAIVKALILLAAYWVLYVCAGLRSWKFVGRTVPAR